MKNETKSRKKEKNLSNKHTKRKRYVTNAVFEQGLRINFTSNIATNGTVSIIFSYDAMLGRYSYPFN